MEQKVTKLRLKRIAKLSDIKVLTDKAKNLIVKLEADNKDKCVICDTEQTNTLISGFKYSGTQQHYKSSLLYAIARILSVLGYAKKPTGKSQTLIEDIKRVQFDKEQNELSFNFTDKYNFVK